VSLGTRVVSVLCIFGLVYCASAQQVARAHEAYSGDLVGALEFISTTFHVPIVAELTRPYPTHVSLSAGQDSVGQILNVLGHQLREYTWLDQDGVVLFLENRLRNAPENFFNRKIAYFVMPGNMADLVLELNQAMGAKPGTAPVMTGVPEKALSSVRLRQGQVFTNASGRELLVEGAKQSRNFFSVVLFPTPYPKTKTQIDEVHNNWYVRSIYELQQTPLVLRSIDPKTRSKHSK
jgi:hypothetical protein